jgi:Excalibur calcium-binding domain
MSQYNYGPGLDERTAYAQPVPQPRKEFGVAFGRVFLGARQHSTGRRAARGVVTSLGAFLVVLVFAAAFSGTAATTTKTAAESTVTTTVSAPAVTTTVTAAPSVPPAPIATSVSQPSPAKPKAAPKPAAPKAAPKPPATHSAAPPVVPAPPVVTPDPPSNDVYYANCTAARAAGAAPLYRGEPGYRAALDRDDDGVACE